jgi:hypothetical protein
LGDFLGIGGFARGLPLLVLLYAPLLYALEVAVVFVELGAFVGVADTI